MQALTNLSIFSAVLIQWSQSCGEDMKRSRCGKSGLWMKKAAMEELQVKWPETLPPDSSNQGSVVRLPINRWQKARSVFSPT